MKDDIAITEDVLSKFLAGEALPEEAMMVEDWAAKSDANRTLLDSYCRIFNLPERIYSSAGNQLAWEKIVRSIGKNENLTRVRVLGWYIGIAASIILLVFISILINYSHHNTRDLVYYTNTDTKKLQLNDAAEITLLPNSALTVDKGFGKSNRKLKLTGSASFSVRHSKAMPLIIDMNGFYVQDLGTKFTIESSANADTIYVAVEEGEVSAYNAFGAKVIINAHEKAFYIKFAKKLAMLANDGSASKQSRFLSNPQKARFDTINQTTGSFLTDTNKFKGSQKPVPADSDQKKKSNPTNIKPIPGHTKTPPGSSANKSGGLPPKPDNGLAKNRSVKPSLKQSSSSVKPKPVDTSGKKPD